MGSEQSSSIKTVSQTKITFSCENIYEKEGYDHLIRFFIQSNELASLGQQEFNSGNYSLAVKYYIESILLCDDENKFNLLAFSLAYDYASSFAKGDSSHCSENYSIDDSDGITS